jgi:hypothetical protein
LAVLAGGRGGDGVGGIPTTAKKPLDSYLLLFCLFSYSL